MTTKYLDIFLREAHEHLQSLQTKLLVLEKEPGNGPLITGTDASAANCSSVEWANVLITIPWR